MANSIFNSCLINFVVKAIDQQLKMILESDILKIEDANVRNAVFLQLIAA